MSALLASFRYDLKYRIDVIRERVAIVVAPWIVYDDVRKAYSPKTRENVRGGDAS